MGWEAQVSLPAELGLPWCFPCTKRGVSIPAQGWAQGTLLFVLPATALDTRVTFPGVQPTPSLLGLFGLH